jgi:hypothetical protein
MYKVTIMAQNDIVLENTYFLRPPTESQLNTVWVEAIKRHGAFIRLFNEPTRYIEMGA